MTSRFLGLIAETSIHVGTGKSEGVVDLPIARELATSWPVLPGSGMKGAFRADAVATQATEETVKSVFGKEDATGLGDDAARTTSPGGVIFGDARLVLMPIRSLEMGTAWVTCPAILTRLQRDLHRVGMGDAPSAFDLRSSGFAVPESSGLKHDKTVLEDMLFETKAELPSRWTNLIGRLLDPGFHQQLQRTLMVIADDRFSLLCGNGGAVPVHTRNALSDDKTVTDGALWSEEALSPDTVFSSILTERTAGTLGAFEVPKYLQVGGNETVGQGWLSIHEVGTQTA